MTNQISWTSDAPLVIAHRGASLIAPENTMAAFRLAEEIGADGIEFDVKLSRDGVAVVHHDTSLGRTTDGTGRIKDIHSTELFRLDAGVKFNVQFSGETIPSLKRVLVEFQDQILLNLELTNYNSPFDRLPQIVVSELAQEKLEENILISSFNPIALRKIRILNPDLRTALLVGELTPVWVRHLLQRLIRYNDFHPHFNFVNQKMVQRLHHAGKRVNAWTVNDYSHMIKLMSIGVDAIITDDVPNAIRAREARKEA